MITGTTITWHHGSAQTSGQSEWTPARLHMTKRHELSEFRQSMIVDARWKTYFWNWEYIWHPLISGARCVSGIPDGKHYCLLWAGQW